MTTGCCDILKTSYGYGEELKDLIGACRVDGSMNGTTLHEQRLQNQNLVMVGVNEVDKGRHLVEHLLDLRLQLSVFPLEQNLPGKHTPKHLFTARHLVEVGCQCRRFFFNFVVRFLFPLSIMLGWLFYLFPAQQSLYRVIVTAKGWEGWSNYSWP